MVRRLQSFARTQFEQTRMPPEPDTLVDDFVEREAERYAALPEDQRGSGCDLLVVGACQQWLEHNGKRLFRVARCTTIHFPLTEEHSVEIS